METHAYIIRSFIDVLNSFKIKEHLHLRIILLTYGFIMLFFTLLFTALLNSEPTQKVKDNGTKYKLVIFSVEKVNEKQK